MKKFARTAVGKTLLILGCTIMACLCLISAASVAAMVESQFYTKTEKELKEEMLSNDFINKGQEILDRYAEYQDSEEVVKLDGGSVDFQLEDQDGKVLAQSTSFEEGTTVCNTSLEYGVVYKDNKIDYSFYTGYYHEDEKDDVVTLRIGLKENSEKNQGESDAIALKIRLLHFAYSLKYAIIPIGAASGILAILCFVILMQVAGMKPEMEECQEGFLHAIPFDLMVLAYAFCGIGSIATFGYRFSLNSGTAVIFSFMIVLFFILFIGLCMSGAARAKRKTLWRGMFIVRLIRGIAKGATFLGRNISLLIKSLLIIGILSVLEFFCIVFNLWEGDNILLFWFIEKIIVVPVILYIVIQMKRLKQGGKALAEGNLNYLVDEKIMRGEFKEHAANLNSIAAGMSVAVEKQLKSERMKTELITNVSHDIKTPLTSIVNYATLLGNEESDNERIKEYSEVLLRQSERMKRLIEDLVEASKASTGNLEVELTPCNVEVFLTQMDGEYIEKLEKARLELVITKPEKEVRIQADGRRMWRIFDNLMNNICKYAKEDTRVYVDLVEEGNHAVISFKNISRARLNISADELMERFVRGDESRTTEGNGLGLSIAKSLAELQNGSLDIEVDGDLFKVVLAFPLN